MRNKPCTRTAVWTLGFLAFLVLSGACDKVTTYSGGGSQHTLTISRSGAGTGTVTSSPSGINCGSTCSAVFSTGATVTLTTAAASGSYFTGWIGACSGTGTCVVTMSSDRAVTAAFAASPQYTLSVAKSGAGAGTVTSSPSGISCGATCSANFTVGSGVTLTATPDSSSAFAGWSGGGCSGTGTCTVPMSAAQSVTALFSALPQYQLTIFKLGAGLGTVTSSPSGINCGSVCYAFFNSGAAVTLTAVAASGSSFTGWSGGGCSGTGTCVVTMSAAQFVTALFSTLPQNQLTIFKLGSGLGTVTSSPSGINCGAACYAFFNSGAVVTLTAVAASGSTFTGWSGACSGTGTCTVTMSAAQNVTATFAPPYALTVSQSGSGSGTVTSFPSGIACGATCVANFPFDAVVTLSAVPASGSAFVGWSGGGCSGTGACEVTMSAAQSVTASFSGALQLSVVKAGAGTGAVTSSPSGIDCGATCAANFPFDAIVTLTASPASGSTFAGWSGGGCSGIGACVVTMSAAQSVTATFSGPLQLSVATAGTGSGTVTSLPSGINCGATCSANFPFDAVVTLSAAPASGSSFAGWSGGGCSGIGACVVTMSAAQSVTATFSGPLQLSVATAGTGSGTVTSLPSGINCGATCSANFPFDAVVTLSAAPASGSTFAGWSGGGCSGTGTCAVTMSAAQSVTATFSGPLLLTVVKSGAGTGTVTSYPAGIDCGATCSASFPGGSSVTLDAAPDPGFTFMGWSGAGCLGTGACEVSMSAAQSVTATFSP